LILFSIYNLPLSAAAASSEDTKSYYPDFDGSTPNRVSLGYFWNRPEVPMYLADGLQKKALSQVRVTPIHSNLNAGDRPGFS